MLRHLSYACIAGGCRSPQSLCRQMQPCARALHGEVLHATALCAETIMIGANKANLGGLQQGVSEIRFNGSWHRATLNKREGEREREREKQNQERGHSFSLFQEISRIVWWSHDAWFSTTLHHPLHEQTLASSDIGVSLVVGLPRHRRGKVPLHFTPRQRNRCSESARERGRERESSLKSSKSSAADMRARTCVLSGKQV